MLGGQMPKHCNSPPAAASSALGGTESSPLHLPGIDVRQYVCSVPVQIKAHLTFAKSRLETMRVSLTAVHVKLAGCIIVESTPGSSSSRCVHTCRPVLLHIRGQGSESFNMKTDVAPILCGDRMPCHSSTIILQVRLELSVAVQRVCCTPYLHQRINSAV